MSKIRNQTSPSIHPADLERLAGFRLMDDDFFSEVLDGKVNAVQYILNTVLERNDLEVVATSSQKAYKSATGRSIGIDIWAKDKDGRIADIEIQRDDAGAGAKRARYHSSMLDRDLLDKGQDYDTLKETFVIFITENDIYKAGLPLYHADRTIRELKHTPFGDDAHIIYVNGRFQDDTHPIGRLMHDFRCTKADDMYSQILAKEVRYMKETEGGQRQMSKIIEEMRTESREEGKLIQLYELAHKGILTFDVAAAEAGRTPEEFRTGMEKYFAQTAAI